MNSPSPSSKTTFEANTIEASCAPPIIVLDTNIVLDWLVFEDGGIPELFHAIESRAITVASNSACFDELKRVLGYVLFELDPVAQTAALIRYESFVQTIPPCASLLGRIPRCRDKDDQKFIDLAAHAGAAALFSKDNRVLSLKNSMRERFGCEILPPGQVRAWLNRQNIDLPSPLMALAE